MVSKKLPKTHKPAGLDPTKPRRAPLERRPIETYSVFSEGMISMLLMRGPFSLAEALDCNPVDEDKALANYRLNKETTPDGVFWIVKNAMTTRDESQKLYGWNHEKAQWELVETAASQANG